MINYSIDRSNKTCHLKVFTRIRPGFIEYLFTSIDLETFDLDYELKGMRLEIQSPWNGTMTKEKYELVSTQNGFT